jgi:hypothetical protein
MARYGICFTLNKYTAQDVMNIQGAEGRCGISYLCYGFEVGENGTPHMQGYFQSNHDKYDCFKKLFKCNPHFEKQKAEMSGPSEAEKQGIFGKPYTAVLLKY